MKLITPEISWHQKEPIFSIDFCPETWKLASCGADFTIKVCHYIYIFNHFINHTVHY